MLKEKNVVEKEALIKKGIFEKWKSKLSHKFVMVLAIVSILGFAGIVSETIFNYNINIEIQASWLVVIGIGMLAEAQIKTLGRISQDGLTPNNFTHLITTIIGFLTVVAGFFSFPAFGIVNPSFHALRGIISIIAIVVIVIQTWLIE